jgi:outer membrane lipoprotein SlyB
MHGCQFAITEPKKMMSSQTEKETESVVLDDTFTEGTAGSVVAGAAGLLLAGPIGAIVGGVVGGVVTPYVVHVARAIHSKKSHRR